MWIHICLKRSTSISDFFYLLWCNMTIGVQARGESAQGSTPSPTQKNSKNELFQANKWLRSDKNKSSHEFCLYITHSSRRLFLLPFIIRHGRFFLWKRQKEYDKGFFPYWLMFIYNCLTSCFKSIPVNYIY